MLILFCKRAYRTTVLNTTDESAWICECYDIMYVRMYTGVSGNVVINEDADRVTSYTVWDYAEGQDLYYNSMLVDLTQPPDKVTDTIPL